MKRLVFIFALLCAGPVWGTTYYMRGDGSAANKGAATSCSAAGTAMSLTTHNSQTFSAGDVITLCDTGGTFSTTELIPPSSGSAGNPINYVVSGSPVISGGNYPIYVLSKSYLNFTGIKVTNAVLFGIENDGAAFINYTNMEATLSVSSGMDMENGSHDITVTGGSSHNNGGSFDQNGIGIGGNTLASYNIRIVGVDIYSNARQGIDIATTTTNAHPYNITVLGCRLRNNTLAGYEADGGSTGLVLEASLLYGNATDGIDVNTGAMSDDPVLLVYNNVIYGNTSKGVQYASGYDGGLTTFKNNIFAENGTYEMDALGGTVLTADYNDYYHSAGGNFMVWSGTATTFAGWKIASSQDANGISSNPLFTNAVSGNFTLLAGSPAIRSGVNLGAPYQNSLSPLSSWPGSVFTVPQFYLWTMGAFSLTSLGPSPVFAKAMVP